MDFDKISSDIVVSSIRVLLSFISGIILIPIVVKAAGVDTYGIWVALIAITDIFIFVGGVHLHGALIRFYPKNNGEQIFSNILFITGILAILCVCIFIALAGVWDQLLPSHSDRGHILLLASYIFLRMVFEIVTNYPRAQSNVMEYELITIFYSILRITVLSISFLVYGTIISALISIVALCAITNIVLLIRYQVNLLPTPNIKGCFQYLRYGLPMVPKEFSQKLLSHGDKILIIYFISPAASGMYTISYGVASILAKSTNILNPTLYPTIAESWDKDDHKSISKLYENILEYYFIFAIPGAVGLGLLSKSIITIISTPEIAQSSWHIVPILCLAFIFIGLEESLTYPLAAAERTEQISKVVFLSAVLNIILNILLIPIYGLIGAAVATALSQFVKPSILFYKSKELVDINYTGHMVKESIFCAFIMGAFLVLMKPYLTLISELVLLPLIGSILYFTLIYLISGFNIYTEIYNSI